jgi:hypothetical protein
VRWAHAAPALAALVGFAWYVTAVGAHTLDPTEMGWLMQGDFAAHLFGWLFFRNDPWTLPLGTISGLLHPIGTTVGFTDANPWVSVLLKPLSSWLPVDFQFIGPWLAVSFALQGFFGAKITAELTTDRLGVVLGGTLFALAPPLLQRMAHDTLCAQWLILAAIWLHVRGPRPLRNTVGWAYALSGIAAGVHPYLAAMLVPLTLALLVRLQRYDGHLGARAALALGAGIIAQTIVVFAAFGYLGSSAPLPSQGFGMYSSDLLTLINPMTASRWLPAWPAGEGQYEGLGFLGSGVLALALLAVLLHGRSRRLSRAPGARAGWSLSAPFPPACWPLVTAAALMAVFALSDHVTIAGYRVLIVPRWYDLIDPLPEIFRASGRFIWPLHYMLLTAIIAVIVRAPALRPRLATAVLLGAAVVQAAEVPGVWPATRTARIAWPPPRSAAWEALGPPYRHLVLYPPFTFARPQSCEPVSFDYGEVIRLSDTAYRAGLTINSAYVARTPVEALESYCRQLRADVPAGRFADDAVYVFNGPSRAAASTALTCAELDGFDVCVTTEPDTAFRRALAASASLVDAPVPAVAR